MELRDWIALGQALLLAAVGIYFAIRLEKIRKLYARNLKRYDLLHTARFDALETADDRLVDVQKAEFDAYVLIQPRGPRTMNQTEKIEEALAHYRKVLHAAVVSKVKCEKYFDEGFNKEFSELLGKLQASEMRLVDVWENRLFANAAQLEDEKYEKMNTAVGISRPAIPAFRKRMGVIIQEDIEQ